MKVTENFTTIQELKQFAACILLIATKEFVEEKVYEMCGLRGDDPVLTAGGTLQKHLRLHAHHFLWPEYKEQLVECLQNNFSNDDIELAMYGCFPDENGEDMQDALRLDALPMPWGYSEAFYTQTALGRLLLSLAGF